MVRGGRGAILLGLRKDVIKIWAAEYERSRSSVDMVGVGLVVDVRRSFFRIVSEVVFRISLIFLTIRVLAVQATNANRKNDAMVLLPLTARAVETHIRCFLIAQSSSRP